MRAARWWIGTVFPSDDYPWSPPESLKVPVAYLRGQQERCPSSGRVHYQLLAAFTRQVFSVNERSDCSRSSHWSGPDTGSPLAHKRRETMFGRKTLPCLEPNLKSEPNLFAGTTLPTGTPLDPMPKPESWSLCRRTYTFGKFG